MKSKQSNLKIKEKKDPNKYQKSHKSKSTLALKSLDINYHFLTKVCSYYYYEFEYICFSIVFTTILIFFTELGRLVHESFLQSNLTMTFILFSISTLFVLSLKLSWEDYKNDKGDDLKLELFFAFNAAIISFMMLYAGFSFLQLNIESPYQEFCERISKIFVLFRYTFNPSIEYYYGFIAIICAFSSIIQVQCAIHSAYYYQFITRYEIAQIARSSLAQEDQTYNNLYKLLTFTFIAPLILSTLFIPPLNILNYLLPYISQYWIDIIRLGLVILYIVIRIFVVMSKEIQWGNNQMFYVVKYLAKNPSDKLFDDVVAKMLLQINDIWITFIKYSSSFFSLFMLVLLIFHKGGYFNDTILQKFDFSSISNKNVNPQSYESLISSTSTDVPQFMKINIDSLVEIINEVTSKGLIPKLLIKSTLNFIILWNLVSYCGISIIALLYYRQSHKTKG